MNFTYAVIDEQGTVVATKDLPGYRGSDYAAERWAKSLQSELCPSCSGEGEKMLNDKVYRCTRCAGAGTVSRKKGELTLVIVDPICTVSVGDVVTHDDCYVARLA